MKKVIYTSEQKKTIYLIVIIKFSQSNISQFSISLIHIFISIIKTEKECLNRRIYSAKVSFN